MLLVLFQYFFKFLCGLQWIIHSSLTFCIGSFLSLFLSFIFTYMFVYFGFFCKDSCLCGTSTMERVVQIKQLGVKAILSFCDTKSRTPRGINDTWTAHAAWDPFSWQGNNLVHVVIQSRKFREISPARPITMMKIWDFFLKKYFTYFNHKFKCLFVWIP